MAQLRHAAVETRVGRNGFDDAPGEKPEDGSIVKNPFYCTFHFIATALFMAALFAFSDSASRRCSLEQRQADNAQQMSQRHTRQCAHGHFIHTAT